MKKVVVATTFILVILLVSITPAKCLAQEYVLGENDLIKVTVFENNDLTIVARINGNDKIQMPLIGEVTVGGLT
ncbi:MAG: polysaccharide biosynthesis/export family protein, partial [Nitrospirota bacterium]